MRRTFFAVLTAAAVFASCAKSGLELLPQSSEQEKSGVTMSVIPSFEGSKTAISQNPDTHTSTTAPTDEQMNVWYAMDIDALDQTVFCPGIGKSILKIADHYDFCRAVDLYAVNGFNENVYMPKHDAASGGCHPGAEGHAFIANKIWAECGSWIEE